MKVIFVLAFVFVSNVSIASLPKTDKGIIDRYIKVSHNDVLNGLGPGARTCNFWLKAKRENNELRVYTNEFWAVGFINAMSFMIPDKNGKQYPMTDKTRNIALETLYTYCEDNPNSAAFNGAISGFYAIELHFE